MFPLCATRADYFSDQWSPFWGFISANTGVGAALVPSEQKLLIGGEAFGVTFCPNDRNFYCFFVQRLDINVIIPKDGVTKHQFWKRDGRIFCVQSVATTKSGKPKEPWVSVWSGKGTDCAKLPGEQLMVLSDHGGLRYVAAGAEQPTTYLLAQDDVGFGAKGQK